MSMFVFPTDDESEEFCTAIAHTMVALFGISEVEAIGRINRHWRNISFTGTLHVYYHEDEEYWAKEIYYGHGSRWWLKEGKEELKPLPFPDQD